MKQMANICSDCGHHYMKHGRKDQCPVRQPAIGKKRRFTRKPKETSMKQTALRSNRAAIIEECARVADRVSIKASAGQSSFSQGRMTGADEIAEQIRSLSSQAG